jgi:N-acetylglucosamine kinase-like BadF-type ATPase
VTAPLLLAVDGGNSKTELALLRADGEVLSLVRGPWSSPHHLGLPGALDVLDELLERAAAEAGLPDPRPLARLASLQLAGLDFPAEVRRFEQAAGIRAWAEELIVGNDTFALLRAGSERGWGVAVVCGAGINCVGVAPDGRHARFPALGPTTGDWGGGYDLGLAAISAAARSEDGRGPHTALEQLVPAHFGVQTPSQLAEAIHNGRFEQRRIIELAPIVLGAADDDAVAAEIVTRLAREVVTLARVALERLDLLGERVEVILGGGILAAGNHALTAQVETGLRALSPAIEPHVADAPPIVGAALLALDETGASPDAKLRARRELTAAARQGFVEASHGA